MAYEYLDAVIPIYLIPREFNAEPTLIPEGFKMISEVFFITLQKTHPSSFLRKRLKRGERILSE